MIAWCAIDRDQTDCVDTPLQAELANEGSIIAHFAPRVAQGLDEIDSEEWSTGTLLDQDFGQRSEAAIHHPRESVRSRRPGDKGDDELRDEIQVGNGWQRRPACRETPEPRPHRFRTARLQGRGGCLRTIALSSAGDNALHPVTLASFG
jgi:hypothetical protein